MASRSDRTPDFGYSMSGEQDWLSLHKALKQAEPELRKELTREMKKAAKPLVAETRDVIGEVYPQSGGLAETLAKPMSNTSHGKKQGSAVTPVVLTGRYPGVGVRVRSVTVKLGEFYGIMRHPVHAHGPKETWAWAPTQRIPRTVGQIRERIFAKRDLVVPHVHAAVEAMAQKVIDLYDRGR